MADQPNPAAARIARETNAYILALEDRFGEVSAHTQGRDSISLFCECGCMEMVTVTRFEYDEAGGAWAESHKPTNRPTR